MNNTFKIFSSVLLAMFISILSATAQDRILIRGKVINAADKSETLIGVTVAEMDQDNRIVRGTTTDMNGDYSITVDNVAGRKLVFSYVGFKSQTVVIGTQAVINMSLEEESTELGAVEIVAQRRVSVGALNISERDMTSSYSRLDARELDALPVASIDQALQGRMAGVDIVANSGQPGAGMSIRIRGTSSINSGSDPLIVVNGIPYETEISSDFDFATADEEGYSQLLNISPSDIQEITVLKDAASTAQYGSKGANGVLMIRTKRGTMGKPRVTYSGKGNVTVPRKPIPTLNGDQYSTLILEANMNAGTPLNLASYPEFARDPNNPYYFYNFGQNTDWVSEVQKIAFQQDHNFSLSGGGERAQYRISAGYLDEKGNQRNSAYKRFSTTTSLNYSISDKIVVVADFNYTHGTRLGAYMTDILSSSYTRMPNQSIYEYTEDGIRTPNYFSPTTHAQGSFTQDNASSRKGGVYNPVAMVNNSEYNTTTDRIRPVFTLQYNVLEWLNYQGTLSFDIGSTKNKGFLPKAATGLTWVDNAENMTTDSDQETFNIQITNQLNVSPKISEQVEFNGLLKFVTVDKHTDAFSTRTSNTASTFQTDPSNPSRPLALNSGMTQERSLQSTGIVHWKFFDKYVVQGTVNYEGNSRFGEGHRFGLFPSASVRWRVSGEPFFKDLTFLNDFSLRATYGVTGNAPGKNYLYYNQYGSYDYTYLDDLGMYPESIELRDLRWEKTGELDLGFNVIAFNNRLNIDFDWYKRITDDQMFNNANIPSTSGVGSITMNVGTVENRGWELSVFTTPVRKGDWEVDFRFNLSRNQNMVRNLSDNVPTSLVPTAENGKYMMSIQENNPIGSFYGYRYNGVYLNQDETIARDAAGNQIYTYNEMGQRIPVQMRFWYPTNGYAFEAGDARYEDINHDGNIDYMDIVYLGDSNPLLTGGFGPAVTYKHLTVEAFFNFRYGYDIVNQTKMDMEKMYDFNNQSTSVLRRWLQPYASAADAPSDLLPRALYRKGYNWLGSDRFVEDGSFLQFKSLTVRYRFDREWLQKKLGMSELSLNFTAYNLYLWTRYTGMNPEVNMRSVASADGMFRVGYDTARAPSNMQFSFGVNVTL